MFESALVDKFSRTHWSVVPALFAPAVVVMLLSSVLHAGVSPLVTAALASTAFLAWTLVEYLLHRFFFHWIPDTPWGARMHFLVHGVHHDWPRDALRLVMPPAVSLSLFFLFLMLFVGTMGRYAWAFHAGFVAGYIYYDTIHYYMHHGSPRFAWIRALRRHHLVHHSPKQGRGRKFGVSTTLWDHVFRTY